ncbi:CD4 protein, partial [Rhinopomastus cyanomelas]|nr:CD4 protein [Rhinopomastus cyanomelas]
RSEINTDSKHLKILDLRLSDAGTYTCIYDHAEVSVSLHVFELIIPSDGHFLTNQVPRLTLMQNSSHSPPDLHIRLFNREHNAVKPKLIQKETRQKYTLELNKLEATDSGTWICHIHSDSPLINQNITFAVKVLGFQNPDFERRYAAADSNIILSWSPNFQKIQWKVGFTGQLNWKQRENTTAHELLDFNISVQGQWQKTKKSTHFQFEIPESERTIEVKLPKVHFNHSGQYQCQLAYNGTHTKSSIELVVMKVSANPVGPLLRGAEMTLICQVSNPLPPNAHLSWEHVNGTKKDMKKSKQHEVKVEVNVSAAGLWNCHLIEDNVRKISLNYLVEEAPDWIIYTVTGASIGGSVLVFGLACLCIIGGISWQRRRQRAKRMARARQYLLENKTCQCQQ